MTSNTLSTASSSSTAASASASVGGGSTGPRSPFLCYNCGKEGHGTRTCTVARDEKAIAARRGANRTPAAKADKRGDEALVRQLRARVEQLEQIELARVRDAAVKVEVVAQVAKLAPAAPAVAIVANAEVAHQNPAPGAAVGVPPAVMVDGPVQGPALPMPMGPIVPRYLCDSTVMDFWEAFWWVIDLCVRVVCGLGVLSGISLLIYVLNEMMIAIPVLCTLWAAALFACWWFRGVKQDFIEYQLIGSAYSEKVHEGDTRHCTFRTCPVSSPNYEPDANYKAYRLTVRKNGKTTRKTVIISITLWREAGAPKNEARYTTAASMATCYADTASFLTRHGHVNLDKDIQADQHVLNNTAKFYAFKLKVDQFSAQDSTNVSSQ